MATILCYHSIDPDWLSPLSVPTEIFAAQASWLARQQRLVPLERAVEIAGRSGRLPGSATALTFDDGYAGTHRNAVPILRRLGLPATMFVVSGSLDGTVRPAEWVERADLGDRDVEVVDVEGLRELADAGWSFGSHSHRHLDLTELSEEECRRDLATSREALEDLLHRPVPWLAYPRGRHAAHVRRAAARAGYTHAFGLPETPERPGPLAIPRVGIYRGDGVASMRAKLSRWYLPLRTGPAFPMAQRAVHGVRRMRGRAS